MAHLTKFTLSFGDYSDPGMHVLLVQASGYSVQLLAISPDHQPLLFKMFEFIGDESEHPQAFKDWLYEHASWLQKWGRVMVLHQCEQATMVPAALYNVDNGKELLDIQFGDLFRGTLLTEQVGDRQDYLVYRIPSDLYQTWMIAHPGVQHRHLFSIWINWLDRLPKDPDGQVFLLFETSRVMMAIRRDDWLLVQQYEYQSPEDVLYFLLSAIQSFDLSPETVKLVLDGFIETQSSLYLELFKYFRHLELASLPEGVQVSDDQLQDFPVHYFTPLIQMAQCVS